MKTQSLTLRMVGLLFIGLLSFPAFPVMEEDCKCHDRPDTPCVRQRITLQDVVFQLRTVNALNNNAAHTAVYEAGQNSEVWVLIETVPSGACRACAQTYVLYAPNRDVKSDKTYQLFTSSDVSLIRSNVVFSMTECSPASSLSMRIAVIEDDDSYSDSLALLSPYLSEGLVLGETGDRSGTTAETRGWSARLDGAWLNSLADLLTQDPGNDVVLPATSIGAVSMDGSSTTMNVGTVSALIPQWVQLELSGDSYPIGCDLRCSKDDTPTDAETYYSGAKLCALASVEATAQPGYTEVTSGSALPTNAVKQEMSVKKETRTRPDGTKIEYVFIVRVLRFRDGSVYVESYSVKRVTGADSKTTETVLDCLQATSLRGYDRAKIRSLLEMATGTYTVCSLSGGSPSSPLCLPAPVEATCGIAAVPDELTVIVPSNSALDLRALGDAADAAQYQQFAEDGVAIHADRILLPEGSPLESMVAPAPVVFPAEDRLALAAPEVATVDCSEDRIDVLLANVSGAPAVVSLASSDTMAWTLPVEQDIELAPGEVAILTFHVRAGEPAVPGETSFLGITADAGGLVSAACAVELRCTESDGETSEGTPETPSIAFQVPGGSWIATTPGVPEDIRNLAQILAWKGGQLGRTDPSQEWGAEESSPGEFCEPCGHTPMCEVCMEWDLEQWQLHRSKSLTDMVALMAVLSYLAQVSGQPEYQAVASIYWNAHWDGWHNRSRPW